MDVLATSVFNAGHICVTHGKANRGAGFPRLTDETTFDAVIYVKVYRVTEKALQSLIIKERQERRGPREHVFSQRPALK